MLSYLALGDSYTIGEQVLLTESFPYQTVQLLRKKNIDCGAPEIIARTGWTTDELANEMRHFMFRYTYDFVSLLIGVNNQYRGRSAEEFEKEFEGLVWRAIKHAGNHANHVFVFSIPDWGVTPFAKDRDVKQIASEIDRFNKICAAKTKAFGCNYIDITTSQRKDNDADSMVAADGLHPSAKEYLKWATKLSTAVSGLHFGENA